ncbi:hypothetical protein Pcinc_019059 [Petrolisthes cinctipes]|uniref:Uncharacterized protein n=1 Tax=Petrolisthes cinctipes TaxID=88211 RepID=A0AAE1KLN8_PETCI|nr:hypothetical protein Pcinc_019059 [Petrolisthes cinctipes]
MTGKEGGDREAGRERRDNGREGGKRQSGKERGKRQCLIPGLWPFTSTTTPIFTPSPILTPTPIFTSPPLTPTTLRPPPSLLPLFAAPTLTLTLTSTLVTPFYY